METQRVIAVIASYKRKDLLRECLLTLAASVRPVDGVVVVDNASEDGTLEMLGQEFPQVDVVALRENTGSAGGFHHGIKRAYNLGADWVWILDNDCLVKPDTLGKLLEAVPRLEALGPRPSVLVSRIVWTDGRLHPMNTPWPDPRRPLLLIKALRQRCLLTRWMSFTTMLVHRRAIAEFGLPNAAYFLWSDDVEYSGRILKKEYGYLVWDSVAVHKTPTPSPPAGGSGERFYYEVRNRVWLVRGSAFGMVGKVAWSLHFLGVLIAYLWANRGRGWPVVKRGFRDGLTTEPPRDRSMLT